MFEHIKMDNEEKRTISHMYSIAHKELTNDELGFLQQVIQEWDDIIRKRQREYYNKVGNEN